MARVVAVRPLTDTSLAFVNEPRDDIVREALAPDGSFTATDGPFKHYRRTVTVDHDAVAIEERTEFTLSIPWFGFLYVLPTKRALRHRPETTGGPQPWWAPPDRLSPRQAGVLGTLAVICLAVGFLNTLLTQTITFAADEFGSSDGDQGLALASVRLGILLSFGLVALADRRGRRLIMLFTLIAAPIACAFGALAPNLAVLAVTQLVGRPLAICMGILVGIMAAEEMPRSSRAYAVSVLALATGFGAGLCVMALPLAGLGVRAWRLMYVLPLAFLVLVPAVRRHLPESRRFLAPHAEHQTLSGHRRRFALLALSGMLLNLLVAPASGFQNRFLRRVRGFSAARISLFTLATNTPGGIGVLVGGRLADTRGRRRVYAVAIVGGTLATVAQFSVAGWPMWAMSLTGAIVGGAGVPAFGAYSSELFPTGLRGKANGGISVFQLAGSSIGLVIVGYLLDQSWSYGSVMALVAVGPLVVAVMVLTLYPETAHRELEDINPEDRITNG